MNNLPKVVAQQRRGRASNPRLLDHKSDALPLSHRATLQDLYISCNNISSNIMKHNIDNMLSRDEDLSPQCSVMGITILRVFYA